jgi:hypothetical protein
MPIMFNTILREVVPALTDVRLLRHKDTRATRGRSPYELWRDNRPQFEIEVAGTSATTEDILAMEGLWQRKLQSNEMGLNRNLASRSQSPSP